MEQTARRQEQLPGAFNGANTNSQHGRVRWYLVHTPNGKERETCEKVRRIIPHELMQDAFVMQKEFWFKRDSAWSLQTKPMYKARNTSSSLRTMPPHSIGLWPS